MGGAIAAAVLAVVPPPPPPMHTLMNGRDLFAARGGSRRRAEVAPDCVARWESIQTGCCSNSVKTFLYDSITEKQGLW